MIGTVSYGTEVTHGLNVFVLALLACSFIETPFRCGVGVAITMIVTSISESKPLRAIIGSSATFIVTEQTILACSVIVATGCASDFPVACVRFDDSSRTSSCCTTAGYVVAEMRSRAIVMGVAASGS